MFLSLVNLLQEIPPMAKPRILVADDDELVRKVLRLGLEREGFAVSITANGAEALERYEHDGQDYAAVILDVVMPILDGPATLRRLQQIDPCVRVYFMTASLGPYETQDLLYGGALQIFKKPFDFREIARELRAV